MIAKGSFYRQAFSGVLMTLFFLLGMKVSLMAVVSLEKQNLEALEKEFSRLDPEALSRKKGFLLIQIGDALAQKGHLDESLEKYQEALLQPMSGSLRIKTYQKIANGLENEGKLAEAIDAYERVLDLDSKNWRRYKDLGLAYEKAVLYEKARAIFEKAVRFRSVDPIVHLYFGRTYRQLKLYELGETQLLLAIKKGVKEPEVDEELSYIYEGEGRFQEAASRYSSVVREGSPIQYHVRLYYLAVRANDKYLMTQAESTLNKDPQLKETLHFFKEFVEFQTLPVDKIVQRDPTTSSLLTLIYRTVQEPSAERSNSAKKLNIYRP